MESAKEILGVRLAKGEISVEEYRTLLDALKDTGSLTPSPTPQTPTQLRPRVTPTQPPPPIDGPLVAEIEELKIYTTHIVVAGRRKKFSEVVSVDGGTNEVKINFLNAVKHSYIKVIFDNGDSYFMDEDRMLKIPWGSGGIPQLYRKKIALGRYVPQIAETNEDRNPKQDHL